MKNKSLQILFLLIFSYQFIFSQEKPKAELVDELGKATCCDLSNRINSVAHSYLADEDTLVYAVIYANNTELKQGLSLESRILGELKVLGINENKFFTLRKLSNEDLKIAFWKVPKNSELPFSTQNEWNLSSINFAKPALFYSSDYANSGICNYSEENKHFSEILLANQELRGHIVIFDSSAKQFNQTEKQLLNEISEKLNVPLNQLRTFFIKQPKINMPYYELWLVPKKSRN
ncbi:MAG: hypothetical protein MUC29_03190 [Pyrinomonadaceae bacterium]|nr:hypothetical protein [Pyrinomonadaceae bacterium]